MQQPRELKSYHKVCAVQSKLIKVTYILDIRPEKASLHQIIGVNGNGTVCFDKANIQLFSLHLFLFIGS